MKINPKYNEKKVLNVISNIIGSIIQVHNKAKKDPKIDEQTTFIFSD
jgi:hypothetical protein